MYNIHLYACMLYNLGFRPSTLTVYVRILIVCGLPHFCWPPMHNQNAHVNGKRGRPGTEAICCVFVIIHVMYSSFLSSPSLPSHISPHPSLLPLYTLFPLLFSFPLTLSPHSIPSPSLHPSLPPPSPLCCRWSGSVSPTLRPHSLLLSL